MNDTMVVEDGEKFLGVLMSNLSTWNECLRRWYAMAKTAQFNFHTDITDENERYMSEVFMNKTRYNKWVVRNAKQYLNHPMYSTLNEDLQRQIRLLGFGIDPTDENDIKNLLDVQNSLQKVYSQATVNGQNFEPDLRKTMAESNDSRVLLDAWWGWRNASGQYMKDDYTKMVRLLNQGARDNNFTDFAAAWIAEQFDETKNLEEIAEQLWEEMRPLYEQLHAYVRTRLAAIYPDYDGIFKDGGIPAHLTGNMWAQNWEDIYKHIKPYPWVPEPDYDDEMIKQEYTVDKMYSMAEEFFTSIGLFPMSEEFNQRSMTVRPQNKTVLCHAAVYDLYSNKPEKDFRIKMCTEVNMNYLETVHHEMGHIEYFMAYQDQPLIYRDGANKAFHEALGDTISLSVRSRNHLRTIGLAGGDHENGGSINSDINYLLYRSLSKIAFLPFGYMVDKWRWAVLRGDVTEDEYNKHWWELRLKYQGVVAPVPRSEADFDPGAKFHIPGNAPYIIYFIGFISQFQFYEAMCQASGHVGPLHQCDFYNSKEAGNKLLEMMKLGKSKPWPEAMEKLTGTREISATAIVNYFRPLHDWLVGENKRTKTNVGWKHAKINWKD